MNKQLIAYAVDFVSFLIDSLDERHLAQIKSIILFGSVARGTATKESDIDLFIDVVGKPIPNSLTERIRERFPDAQRGKEWRLRGIENDIRIICDSLARWKDLRISIISDGIALYTKYTAEAKGKQHVLVYWGAVAPPARRVALSQKLYGYRTRKAHYPGLCETARATKLGPNCILVPLETADKVLSAFKGLKVQARTIYVQTL